MFCKYGKLMTDLFDPDKSAKNTQQNSQFSESGVYVREDDQDWGSSGMNNIDQDCDLS